jgi:S-adenosylmethionine hydrolase
MQIVTLITDFGTKGYRSGALKGSILSVSKSVNIVDISHDINPFDIDEAAFILRSCHANFPAGTIHIINVLNYYDSVNRMIFFMHDGQYFIGPDNAVFSLVFESLQSPIFALPADTDQTHYTAVCASVVSAIVDGKELSEIGTEIDDMKYKLILQPVTAANEIRGAVVFVDRYGNITVNISQKVFDTVRRERSFSLFLNRHDHIHILSDHYMQVDIGSPLCNFNSQGFLEIAVNLERADELLSIRKGDVIQIKFQDQ